MSASFIPYWIAIGGAALGAVLTLAWLAAIVRGWRRGEPIGRVLSIVVFLLFATAYGLNIYAWFIEPRTLVVRQVDIESPHWRGDPISIAVLSDTHAPGPHVDAARLGSIVARVNRLHPDLVVLLGDYVGGRESEAERTPQNQNEVRAGIATFAALNARYGVVAVIGNHDVWYGRTSVTRALEEAGIATLWNRNVVISREGGDVVIAGLADDVTDHPNFAAAIDGAPTGVDTIVLSHTPDAYVDVPAGPALMLAGHTHCGQVSVPFVGRPILPIWNPHMACHRVDDDGKIIYVTGGIGTSFLPVRFLNPPEIVLINLHGAAVQQDGIAAG